MDCKTALRLLEVCRPTDDDLADPGLATATAHLESCPDCLQQFRARQAFDERVATAVRAEPVPAGLRDRIHARLDHVANRRRYLRMSAWAAAAAILLAVEISFWPQRPAELTVIDKGSLGELAILDDTDFKPLRKLDESLHDPKVIDDWWSQELRRLKLKIGPPATWPLGSLVAVGRTTIGGRSVIVFRFDDTRGESDVLVLPRSEFLITNLGKGAEVVHRTRNIVVIVSADEDATYAAVLRDWSPNDWRPLVERSGRLM
jgi:hypothetical protein